MKKAIIVALALVAGATFNSVNAQEPMSRVDSLSYTIGMSQTQGLKDYLKNRLNMDLNYMDDFIKGLNEGAYAGDDKKKSAYYAGLQIGQQILNQIMPGINKEVFGADSTQSISLDRFVQGFVSGVSGKDGLMSVTDAQHAAQKLIENVKNDTQLKLYGANKKAGEDFLAANAKLAKKKKSGIVVLPSGLQYKVLQQGNGPVAKATDKVKVKYEGRLIDGTVFDSTEKHGGEPATFAPNQVIKGWTEALTMMPVGSKWQLYIPQELAYGNRAAGSIPPFSTLIFDVEVLEIVEDKKPADTKTPEKKAADTKAAEKK
jgi:FKBP-type peptidyl-prolyl cis-trans isomerase FklB